MYYLKNLGRIIKGVKMHKLFMLLLLVSICYADVALIERLSIGNSQLTVSTMTNDKNEFITGSKTGIISLWNINDFSLIKTIGYEQGFISSISVSQNGQFIIVGLQNNTAKVWNKVTGLLVNTLDGHSDDIMGVSLNSSGSLALTSGQDGKVILWDVANGTKINEIDYGGYTWIKAIQFSPDDSSFAVPTRSDVELFSASSGELLKTIETNALVDEVMYSKDGNYLAVSADNETIIMDIELGVVKKELNGVITGNIYSMSISEDNAYVAIGTGNDKVVIWDIEAGIPLLILEGHEDWVNYVGFFNDTTIISSSVDNTVKKWNIQSGLEISTTKLYSGGFYSINFSADGSKLASGSGNGYLDIWDPTTGVFLDGYRPHLGSISKLMFTQNDERIITSSFDKSIKTLNLENGEYVNSFEEHFRSVQSFDLISDGNKVISSDHYDTYLWDLSSGAVEYEFNRGYTNRKYSFSEDVSISNNGELAAIGFGTSEAIVISLTNFDTLHVFNHASGIVEVNFINDDATLVTLSKESKITFWDIESGLPIDTSYSFSTRSIDVDKTSKYLVTGSSNGSILLWDLSTFALLDSVKANSGQIPDIKFSPDGQSIASASYQGIIKIWDIEETINLDEKSKENQKLAPLIQVKNGELFISNQLEGSKIKRLKIVNSLGEVVYTANEADTDVIEELGRVTLPVSSDFEAKYYFIEFSKDSKVKAVSGIIVPDYEY